VSVFCHAIAECVVVHLLKATYLTFRSHLQLTRCLTEISCISSNKFGYLILKKIVKIFTIRFHILRLKFTKFHFSWGFVPDPTGGAHSAPSDPWLDLNGPTSKHSVLREGEGGRAGQGEKARKTGERRGKAGGEGRGSKGEKGNGA